MSKEIITEEIIQEKVSNEFLAKFYKVYGESRFRGNELNNLYGIIINGNIGVFTKEELKEKLSKEYSKVEIIIAEFVDKLIEMEYREGYLRVLNEGKFGWVKAPHWGGYVLAEYSEEDINSFITEYVESRMHHENDELYGLIGDGIGIVGNLQQFKAFFNGDGGPIPEQIKNDGKKLLEMDKKIGMMRIMKYPMIGSVQFGYIIFDSLKMTKEKSN